jgi:flagellar protein FliJ
MKKFQFRLETLLQHRRNLEEQERAKFSCIRNDFHAEIARKEALSARRTQTLSELVALECAGCDAQEIMWAYSFLGHLDREMKRASERISQLEKRLEDQKQIMIASSRDKKIIENLKAKREKEFLISVEREEQKSIDDLVITRYAFKP